MGDEPCVVCRVRIPTQPWVCDRDRDRLHEQLVDLPRKLSALTVQLVPGSVALGQRIMSSPTAAIGARLDALTLLGPGSDGLSPASVAGMLSPQIRKWRETEHVTVTVGGVSVDRDVTIWYQELVRDEDGEPLLSLADDQVGLLPPAEWLDSWARMWRQHFGHHQRVGVRRSWSKTATAVRLQVNLMSSAAARTHAAHVVLGMLPGHAGAPTLRTDDPLAEELEIRYGPAGLPAQAATDVVYLETWLDEACDQDVAVGDFASELRSLTSELGRVLGEQLDQQWLGRCPAQLTNRDDGRAKPCGAGLWQDPFATRVTCPRCRSQWGPGGLALLKLAQAIRRTWPIDRHRRYDAVDLDTAVAQARRVLTCPACNGPVDVTWRDVTEAGELLRHWRPDQALCQAGCPQARSLI